MRSTTKGHYSNSDDIQTAFRDATYSSNITDSRLYQSKYIIIPSKLTFLYTVIDVSSAQSILSLRVTAAMLVKPGCRVDKAICIASDIADWMVLSRIEKEPGHG